MRSHEATDYAEQLRQLMPPGLAWNAPGKAPNNSLLEGMADEMARIERSAVRLSYYEFYAQSTRDLLLDWETEYGLPDQCRQPGATYEERIEDLLRKIRERGGQSIAYFVGLAKALGIEVTITEFRPFRIGSRVGERLYGRNWIHVFRVNGPETRVYKFRVGRNTVGNRLRYWRGLAVLECLINKLKPAHTFAIFGYREEMHNGVLD